MTRSVRQLKMQTSQRQNTFYLKSKSTPFVNYLTRDSMCKVEKKS